MSNEEHRYNSAHAQLMGRLKHAALDAIDSGISAESIRAAAEEAVREAEDEPWKEIKRFDTLLDGLGRADER